SRNSRRTAHWGRSPSHHACKSASLYRTTSFRSRASASITTRTAKCSTISPTPRYLTFATASSSVCKHPVSVSTSTKQPSARLTSGAMPGVAPCGVIQTGASQSGDLDRIRSEEHTSELQSRENLVCRLLLEKKKK